MYLGNSRAGGGVDGIGAREGFQGQELIEGTDFQFRLSRIAPTSINRALTVQAPLLVDQLPHRHIFNPEPTARF
jgi:hypothetical protein